MERIRALLRRVPPAPATADLHGKEADARLATTAHEAADPLSGRRAPFCLRQRSSTWFIAFAVGWGVLVDLSSYSLVVPVVPFRLEALGYDDIGGKTGWLVAAYAAGLIVSSPVAGWIGAKYKNRQVPLTLGLLFMAGGPSSSSSPSLSHSHDPELTLSNSRSRHPLHGVRELCAHGRRARPAVRPLLPFLLSLASRTSPTLLSTCSQRLQRHRAVDNRPVRPFLSHRVASSSLLTPAHPPHSALVTDSVPEERLGSVLGYVMVGFSCGQAIGPPVGACNLLASHRVEPHDLEPH